LVSGLSLERKEKMDRIYEEISEATIQLSSKVVNLVEMAGFGHPVIEALAVVGITLHVVGILASSTFEAVNKWLGDLREGME